MSSITAASYRVETAAEIELRQTRAARVRHAAAAEELAALRREAEACRAVYGKDRVGAVPAAAGLSDRAGSADVDAATDELTRLVTRARSQLRNDCRAAARQHVAGLLSGSGSRPATAPAPDAASGHVHRERLEADARAVADRERRVAERRERLVQEAADELARLPGTAAPELLERCRRAVAAVVGAPSEPRARLVLADLRNQVTQAVEVAERVRRTAVELTEQAARLHGAVGPDADAVRHRLAKAAVAAAEQVPAGLVEAVERAVETGDRARRRKVVAAALRLSLEDLDYQVAEGFETVLVDDGVALVRLPGDETYGVKLLLDRAADVVRTQVVRGGSGTPAADEAAERRFCRSYPELLARAARHGLATTALARVEPGARAVAAVRDEELPATDRQKDVGRTRPRERGL